MPAEQDSRWDYILGLDEKLLVGGVVLSEWTTRIVREIDLCFSNGLYLACIILSVSAIESHVKFETGEDGPLYKTIENYTDNEELIILVNKLRKYRNAWVHIDNPREDGVLLNEEQLIEADVEEYGYLAVRVVREVLYAYQWI